MAEIKNSPLHKRCDYCYRLAHLAIVPISDGISMELCSECTNKWFRGKEE